MHPLQQGYSSMVSMSPMSRRVFTKVSALAFGLSALSTTGLLTGCGDTRDTDAMSLLYNKAQEDIARASDLVARNSGELAARQVLEVRTEHARSLYREVLRRSIERGYRNTAIDESELQSLPLKLADDGSVIEQAPAIAAGESVVELRESLRTAKKQLRLFALEETGYRSTLAASLAAAVASLDEVVLG